jgi:hypothetical protein
MPDTKQDNKTNIGPIVHLGSDPLASNSLIGQSSDFKSDDKNLVPIAIKKEKDNKSGYYVIVGNNKEDNSKPLTHYNEIDYLDEDQKTVPKKMDYVTGFYIGSLTIVGLFVFYRLLNKSK